MKVFVNGEDANNNITEWDAGCFHQGIYEDWTIGARPAHHTISGRSHIEGRTDELAVWTRVLSDAEIFALYNASPKSYKRNWTVENQSFYNSTIWVGNEATNKIKLSRYWEINTSWTPPTFPVGAWWVYFLPFAIMAGGYYAVMRKHDGETKNP
jgi:hypothetical protein